MVSFSKKTAFTTTLLVIIVTLMGRDNVVLALEVCSVPMTDLAQCTSEDCTCESKMSYLASEKLNTLSENLSGLMKTFCFCFCLLLSFSLITYNHLTI
jgi:hypothetical protein